LKKKTNHLQNHVTHPRNCSFSTTRLPPLRDSFLDARIAKIMLVGSSDRTGTPLHPKDLASDQAQSDRPAARQRLDWARRRTQAARESMAEYTDGGFRELLAHPPGPHGPLANASEGDNGGADLESVARKHGCDMFTKAMRQVGLDPRRHLKLLDPSVTVLVLAPDNDSMSRLPLEILESPTEMRKICAAHMVLARAGTHFLNPRSSTLKSIQGTVHRCVSDGVMLGKSSAASQATLASVRRIGPVDVTDGGCLHDFAQGKVMVLRGFLLTIDPTEVRPEQILGRRLIPHPIIHLIGATAHEPYELTTTLHHQATKQMCVAKAENGIDPEGNPLEPLRKARQRVPSASETPATNRSYTPQSSLLSNGQELIVHRQVALADTCIDETPPSQARNAHNAKGLASNGGDAKSTTTQPVPSLEGNMYELAYHVLDGNHQPVAAYAPPTPIKLCDSYDAVSADEQMFRTMYGDEEEVDKATGNAILPPALDGGSRTGGSSTSQMRPPSSSPSPSSASPDPVEFRINPERGPSSGGSVVWLYCAKLSPFTTVAPRVMFGTKESSTVHLIGPGYVECHAPDFDMGTAAEWPVTVRVYDAHGNEPVRRLSFTYFKPAVSGSKRGRCDTEEECEEEEENDTEDEEDVVRVAEQERQWKRQCGELMQSVAKTLKTHTAFARARADGPSARSTAAPNASLVASASASPSQLPPHAHSNDDGEPSSRDATLVPQVVSILLSMKRDAAPLDATDSDMKEEEEKGTSRNHQATRKNVAIGADHADPDASEDADHADKDASRSPSLHTLLDVRHVSTDWNVLHYLAALGANAELAAVLSKPQCPIYATDPQGRSPLLVALGRQQGMAAQLLLKAEEKEELPLQAVWESL